MHGILHPRGNPRIGRWHRAFTPSDLEPIVPHHHRARGCRSLYAYPHRNVLYLPAFCLPSFCFSALCLPAALVGDWGSGLFVRLADGWERVAATKRRRCEGFSRCWCVEATPARRSYHRRRWVEVMVNGRYGDGSSSRGNWRLAIIGLREELGLSRMIVE